MKEDRQDLTTGSIWGKMLLFSIPLVLTNFLQVLFNMADIAVIGQFAGSLSLGAVGSTTTLVTLFTGFLIGMGGGTNVLVARFFGAKDKESTIKTIHTALLVSMAAGMIVLIFGLLFSKGILELLNTKEELLDGAVLYIRIYFLGMPAMALYNFGNAVCSAFGDTKKPLYYLGAAGIVNIVLNLFFVIVCKMDVAGVATASIISQYLSAFLILRALVKVGGDYALRLSKLRIDKRMAGYLIQIGLPAGLHADWNDCLRLGAQGESSFVALQLYYAFTIMRYFAEKKNDTEYIAYLDKTQKEIGDKINDLWWEDDRYNRGFKDTGELIGSKNDPEASMWLNPQTWAVISGHASKEQAEIAMESVERELNTAYGAKIMAPSYVDHYFDGALAGLFPPSTKENGGIFSQTQGWLILAEALMGHGDKAFRYFEESSPSSQNDKAEIRKLEPYVHGQYTEGDESPFHGRSHVHWLTGTASTCMVGCVEGICGIRPDLDGLRVAPTIPSDWKEMTMEKNFRGKKIVIKVENPNGAQAGFKEFYINGEKQDDNYIPADKLTDVTEVRMVM